MGTYVITEPCIDVKDGTCVEVCPVVCIHTTLEASQYFIDPDVCIECEQCVIVCPVDAIYVDTEVPDQWKGFIEINAQFFKEVKTPTESIAVEIAMEMIAAAEAYGQNCEAAFAIVIVDVSGGIVAERQMARIDLEAREAALVNAQKAAKSEIRTQSGRAIFDHLDIVGGIGISGGSPEQNGLAVRAGIAAGTDAMKSKGT